MFKHVSDQHFELEGFQITSPENPTTFSSFYRNSRQTVTIELTTSSRQANRYSLKLLFKEASSESLDFFENGGASEIYYLNYLRVQSLNFD